MRGFRFRAKIVLVVFCLLAIVLLYKSGGLLAQGRLSLHHQSPATQPVEGPPQDKARSKKLLKQEGPEKQANKDMNPLKKADASSHGLPTRRDDLAIGDDTQKEHTKPNGTQSKENNQACLIPELDPFDESIRKYLRELPPLKCKGIMHTSIKNKQLVLMKSAAPHSNYTFCFVSTIERISDRRSHTLPPIKIQVDQHQSDVPGGDIPLGYNLTSDFTVVRCLDKKEEMADQDFDLVFRGKPQLFDRHASIHPKPETLQRLRDTKPPVDGLGLNVVLLTLESTSRMNFIRQLPKTRKVLEGLGAIILEGYNIVADATSGAMIPVLTGKRDIELPEVRIGYPGSKYVDTYPMIWRDYAKNGYATMYAEDLPKLGTFTRVFKGFKQQPTDHYIRTMWMATKPPQSCLGPTPVHNVMLDYLMDFMTEYKTKPHFALTFPSSLTHDNINPLQLMDPSLSGFISKTHSLGFLNNTMLVFFGDHGSRYASIRRSYQGKLEERLPFLSITLPPWVSKKHPELVRNLRNNRKRLVTPFDVHETLQSVLHYNPKPGSVNQRGISLFNEIPRERTCEHAGVAPHWCTCLNWKPVESEKKIEVAEALLAEINRNTEPVRDKCAKLSVGKILNAAKMAPDDQVLRFRDTDNAHRIAAFKKSSTVRVSELATIYRVTLEAQPGGGLFEGTIKEQPQNKEKNLPYESTGDISRINRYGNQADCINAILPQVTKFCYCRNA